MSPEATLQTDFMVSVALNEVSEFREEVFADLDGRIVCPAARAEVKLLLCRYQIYALSEWLGSPQKAFGCSLDEYRFAEQLASSWVMDYSVYFMRLRAGMRLTLNKRLSDPLEVCYVFRRILYAERRAFFRRFLELRMNLVHRN